MSAKSIDYALLMALGLSRDSAEIVMDEIDRLRAAVLNENARLEQMTAEIEQLRLELGWLKALRTRLHNIGTGAETTPSDNEALILGVKLIEASYSPPIV